jgi:hypothetical protein
MHFTPKLLVKPCITLSRLSFVMSLGSTCRFLNKVSLLLLICNFFPSGGLYAATPNAIKAIKNKTTVDFFLLVMLIGKNFAQYIEENYNEKK